AVGAHQTTRAQQHTAEVPGDHRDHVRHLVAAQHLQHRDPGRAGGLAVIAGLLHPAVVPDHERRAVVPGLVVELAALQDDITSLVLGAHPLQCAQETGLLHLELVLASRLDGPHPALSSDTATPATRLAAAHNPPPGTTHNPHPRTRGAAHRIVRQIAHS